ncbi:hypothetical protein BGC07_13645 [Piscirickettsia litoralis]|uniref:PglD N-terminal domain-containing protein n=1 Tax=Piscirickettsia litoralis TaxID=1891921 RepID=A0ABX3A7Y7_9GAMM|nr:hypothetical protein BGC07_13645 [Piscirickettsia litoralis]
MIDILNKLNTFNIVGLIDDYKAPGTIVYGYPILGGIENIQLIMEKNKCAAGFIAIGDNYSRLSVYREILSKNKDFTFINVIDPTAVIMDSVTLGVGVTIMPGVIINSNCIINDFCIINTASSIDHDSTIGCFSSLAPGVITGGHVQVEKLVTVSIGVVLARKVKIDKGAVVGAGSVVLSNISPEYAIIWNSG